MRMLIIVSIILAGVGLAVLATLRPEGDGLEAYPHPYLDWPGYDPAVVTILQAPFETPPDPPLGLGFAWRCDDPAFHDDQGRPWLFPVPLSDDPQPPPIHPVRQRRPDPATCRPYHTGEGEQLLEAYRLRMGH